MAKGDHQRMQNQVDQQGGIATNTLNNTRSHIDRQNAGLENRFNQSADQGNQDYTRLMGQNNDMMSRLSGPTHGFGAYGGYQDFANTGGYSPQDISNIRARAVAPMRATYANANRDVDRQRSLQGGYSPNYTAAKAKMARELSYGLADASTNAEASIADNIRQGKLAGLGGMTGIDSALLGSENARLGMGNDTLRTMASLYGTAPGMADMYGRQMLASSGQNIDLQQLQQQINEMVLRGQANVSNTKGNTQEGLANVNAGLDTVGKVGTVISGF